MIGWKFCFVWHLIQSTSEASSNGVLVSRSCCGTRVTISWGALHVSLILIALVISELAMQWICMQGFLNAYLDAAGFVEHVSVFSILWDICTLHVS